MTVPLADVIGVSVEASRPAAGIAGRLWATTDATTPGIYRDDGAAWVLWSEFPSAGAGAAYHAPLIDPVPLLWSFQFNFSGATIVETDGGVQVYRNPSGVAGVRGAGRDTPSGGTATAYTLTAALVPHILPNDGAGVGIAIRSDAGNQHAGIELYFDTTEWVLRVFSAGSYTASPTEEISFPFPLVPLIWFKITTADNVSFTFSWSLDGRWWTDVGTYDMSAELAGVGNSGLFFWRLPTDTTPTTQRTGVTLVSWDMA